MSSSSEQIDDQHKTQRMMMKKFMTNKVKGLKEKMSELVNASSNNCQKMKSWSENSKMEVVHALRKFKGKNKIEKKKKNHEEETDQKYDETTTRVVSSSMKEEEEEEMLSKDSMSKRLYELGEKLEKTMERVRVIETVLEKELARKCSTTVKDEEEHMSDSDETDESESGYCTPDTDSRV